MMTDALLAYFHFAALGTLVALLAVELALCTPAAPTSQLMRLRWVDAGYGSAALLVLATGVARAIWGAKGSAFYLGNPVFHAKVGLFVVVGLLSIYPTVQFLRWAKSLAQDGRRLPDATAIVRVRRVLMLQLGLLALIPMAATFMARGIGAS